jgi:GTP-binding protein
MTSTRELFSAECQFVAGAASSEQIPSYYIPEVAFAGRSNVGKSSLINALLGRKDCARVSKFPGRTQQINFFSLQNKISLVDLPGYGYAAISKKMRKTWDDLILNYLIGRQNLRRVFLLIDARHGIKKNDEEIMKILDDCAVVYQIILTKIDKAPCPDVDHLTAQLAAHTAAYPSIIATSSEKNVGMQLIRAEIAKFA